MDNGGMGSMSLTSVLSKLTAGNQLTEENYLKLGYIIALSA